MKTLVIIVAIVAIALTGCVGTKLTGCPKCGSQPNMQTTITGGMSAYRLQCSDCNRVGTARHPTVAEAEADWGVK